MVQRRSLRSWPERKKKPMSTDPHKIPRQGSNADRVVIFDTTLRDGEQCPGATMTFEEKLEVAECLDAMGVDIIEAGFPSPRTAISRPSPPSPSASRTRPSRASRAPSTPTSTAPATRCSTRKRGRIHTFVSTSPIHLAHQMRKTEAEVLEIITATVARARNLVEDVEWSADGRDAHRHRLSLPLRRGGDQGRRHHHQPARHRRLRDAGGIRRHVPQRARARAERR